MSFKKDFINLNTIIISRSIAPKVELDIVDTG